MHFFQFQYFLVPHKQSSTVLNRIDKKISNLLIKYVKTIRASSNKMDISPPTCKE